MTTARAGVRGRARAYADLVRLPNLFTAPPDVVLGAALAATAGQSVGLLATLGLGAASMALYAAGTTLNDAFDAQRDAEARPERPIPSGRVRRRTAFAVGGALLLAGVALAWLVVGTAGAFVASVLAAAIAAYDGALKGGPLGFAAMGAARGLNVELGATAAGRLPTALPPTAHLVALVVATYVAAVTFMAERETEGGNRGAVATAGTGAILAAVAVVALVAVPPLDLVRDGLALALAAGFLRWVGSTLRDAYADPVPGTVGPAVGTCVVALVVLDAAFAAAVSVGWGAVALAFLPPALLLARTFDVS
jgi:4-hydroxybenzoate polyprenyltransferase